MANNEKTLITKIGITPSEAPFRMTCIRTFIYICAIAEKNAISGGSSNIIFQIDDTNVTKRRHSKEEIIDFYTKMGILPFKHSQFEITSQTDLTSECEEYFNILNNKGFILNNPDGTAAFDIKKYIETYGSKIEVDDKVSGKVTFDANSLTENQQIIIRRSDGTFLYNFCAAVDTTHWHFTTLIRGMNKMSSVPFQNMYITALGFQPPEYYHLPLLLEEKKKNDFDINARVDIRKLLENNFAYMPVLNYLLNTGYGDQSDNYNSLEEFYEKFDINKLHKTNAYFDFNIMKKTCNRFYQHDMTYEEYYDQLKKHIELLGLDKTILNYASIGYKHRLSPYKVELLFKQLQTSHFDIIDNNDLKKKILDIINMLADNYEETIKKLLDDKENKMNNMKIVKYILSGYFDGLVCDAYKDCYDELGYQKRLVYVKNYLEGMK